MKDIMQLRFHAVAYSLLVGALTLAAACAGPPQPASETAAGKPAWPYPTLDHKAPIIIAHRGASGLRPEHTLAAYKLAIEQGADCIEPDLVMSKDGVLIDRHDTFLSTTTNVADHPEFASRKRKASDPEFPDREDWWVADFTLAELKTLRAKQSFRGRSAEFDGQFQIAAFDEVLALAKSSRTPAGKPVCIYPEAKSPAYHAALGMPMAKPILAALKKAGMDSKGSPVFIQSFEPPFVKEIDPMTELPVIMLVGDKAALDEAMAVPGAPFWQGVGATHQMLVKPDGSSTGVIEAAHKAGIAVHAWTYRDDVPMAPGGAAKAMARAFELGLDGAFTDFPATGVRVRQEVGATGG